MKPSIIVILLAFVTPAASAQQNGSFETGPGALGLLPTGSTAIDNWIVTRGNVDWVNTSTWAAADGFRSVDLQGLDSSGGVGQVANTVAGRRYQLTFALAGNPDGAPTIKHMTARAGSLEVPFEFDTTGAWAWHMNWQDRSFTFVAADALTAIEFFSTDPPGSFGAVVDRVRLDEVPCPGDVNGDQRADLSDLTILLAHFGTTSGATLADGDLDGDGDVELSDLTILLSAYGTICT
jgi:choice-of-anchor C domain-containing protein